MREGTYLPVKILAQKFHQSPKTVRQNINEMSKDSSFGKFVINPKEKGSPKLADLGAYAIWIEWKPQRKSYLWRTVYQPKVRELLSNLAIGTGWLLAFILVLGAGLHVFASPIRDGVHTPVYEALQTIDRTEIADMRNAEDRLSQEDEDLLCQVALAEAGYRDPYSQACVMQVILNRVEDERFPSSVSGVVYQPHQFSTASYLSRFDPEDAREGLELLYSGAAEHNALAFCTTSFSWATYAFSVGGNNYFTF